MAVDQHIRGGREAVLVLELLRADADDGVDIHVKGAVEVVLAHEVKVQILCLILRGLDHGIIYDGVIDMQPADKVLV